MVADFIVTWGVAVLGAAALSSVMRSDNPRVWRNGRTGFAFLLAIELLVVARSYDVANTLKNHHNHASRGSWWEIALFAGIPTALVLAFAVRRAYADHQVALISALLATAALYLAFPLGFVPPHKMLTGLGRFEHEHRTLDIVALFIPTLILLASEALRGHIEGPEVKDPSILTRLRLSVRALGAGGAIALAALIWLLGADPSTVLLGLGVLLVGVFVWAWWRDRAEVKRARRNLK